MNINDFAITDMVSFRFVWRCPSCGKEYDLIRSKDDTVLYVHPKSCIHCGFDLEKYETAEEEKHKKEIENNKYCQLRYDVIGAYENGINLHPQKQMRKLGYQLLDSIPQIVADCWWFTVDKIREPLPTYLTKIKYDIS